MNVYGIKKINSKRVKATMDVDFSQGRITFTG